MLPRINETRELPSVTGQSRPGLRLPHPVLHEELEADVYFVQFWGHSVPEHIYEDYASGCSGG